MIKFEANNNKVNWYSEAELQALIPKLIAQMNATATELAAIKSKLGIGDIAAVTKNNNANTYLNGAGDWSTVSSGTSYSIGDNISNNNGTISVPDANASTKGVTKLYTSTGSATDGSMTQAAIKTELDQKITTSATVRSALTAGIADKADSATKLATAQTINGVPFDGSKNIVFGGICNTAGDVAEKEVTIADYTPTNNSVICVRFRYVNTAEKPTLNVNGTGAKSIKLINSKIPFLTAAPDQSVWLMYRDSTWFPVSQTAALARSLSVIDDYSGPGEVDVDLETIPAGFYYIRWSRIKSNYKPDIYFDLSAGDNTTVFLLSIGILNNSTSGAVLQVMFSNFASGLYYRVRLNNKPKLEASKWQKIDTTFIDFIT